MDYKTFVEQLPLEKIQKLDGHYMLFQFNSREELIPFLEKENFLGKTESLFWIENLFILEKNTP